MTLVLEVEYLSGVSFAAIGPESDVPDWPPQPDRIFSALVATWAARGERAEEQQALEWLEKLPAPRLLAVDSEPRTGRTVYVPPNDYETPDGELSRLKWYREYLAKGIRPPKDAKLGNPRKGWMKAVGVAPAWRQRKERFLPATRLPEAPVHVRLLWDSVVTEHETLAALQALASDMAYVGHSASLTRCRFLRGDESLDLKRGNMADRRVYAGRFAELRGAFDAGRRPLSGARVALPEAKREPTNLFGERWLILEHIDGDMPDLRACGIVGKTIRDALLSGYRRAGLRDRIPEVVSGHAVDGTPSRVPHLAVVALPFAGFPHADGHVMGFALVPPRDAAILDDESFRKALRMLAPIDEERGRRVLTVTTKEGTPSDRAFSIALSPTFEPPANKRSLDPSIYTKRAQIFATVTPIVLDRHLKEKEARDEEIATQIASACRNIGLPGPESIITDKHSSIEGGPSAYPSGKSPPWMHWRLPPSLASRQLSHAVIRFPHEVNGPVILGAGRFMGLGLCRPLGLKRD